MLQPVQNLLSIFVSALWTEKGDNTIFETNLLLIKYNLKLLAKYFIIFHVLTICCLPSLLLLSSLS